MNTDSYSQIGQFSKPYLMGHTLPKEERKYCNLLQNNINATNYCKPNDCYYTTKIWLDMPWMKKYVNPIDHAEFTINNNVTSNVKPTERLNYSSYTPFQYDPTWNEFKKPCKFKQPNCSL